MSVDLSRLTSKEERLKTFQGWHNPHVEPELLAQSGFFYFGLKDRVQCVFCRGILENWEEGDDVMLAHGRFFSWCPLVKEWQVGKNSISAIEERKNRVLSTILSNIGLCQLSLPRHPEFEKFDDRLKSFENWPKMMVQKPEDLAEAGFYYCGENDRTKCFYCDIDVCNWKSDADPWVEHAINSEKCFFVSMLRGQTFINKTINQKSSDLLSETETERSDACELRGPTVRDVLTEGSIEDACMIMQETGIDFSDNTTIPSSKGNISTKTSSTVNEPNLEGTHNLTKSSNISGENEKRLNETRSCLICMEEEIGMVFLTCGHLICCHKCAPTLKECPLCRKEIVGTVRAFLS